MNNNSGMTLLETVIAVGMFVIIAVAGTSLLLYASGTGGRIALKSELLENSRITLDFLVNQLRLSEDYHIETDNGVMQIVKVVYYDSEENDIVRHEFIFNAVDGTLSFGGQRLAGHLNTVILKMQNGCLTITIVTNDRVSDMSGTTDTIRLTGKVSLKDKNEF